MARHVGPDHHDFAVKPDALAMVDGLVTHPDEPFAMRHPPYVVTSRSWRAGT